MEKNEVSIMKIFVSPLEKEYFFEELDQFGIDYVKKETTVWICNDCGMIYKEKTEQCTGFVEVSYDKEKGVKNILHNGCKGTDFEVMHLADIVGENMNYAIERKNGSDLIHSLENNKIYIQLQNLKEIFSGNVALVFEGNFEEVANKERERVKKEFFKTKDKKLFSNCEARISQMYSIPAHCLSLGVAFIQVKDTLELLKMLKYFDYKCGQPPKIRDKRESLSKMLPSVVKKLMTIDGIGDKIATGIFKYAQTPAEVTDILRTNPKSLLKVDKLGPKKLENILKDWL